MQLQPVNVEPVVHSPTWPVGARAKFPMIALHMGRAYQEVLQLTLLIFLFIFQTLIGEVVLDSILVLAHNCSRLAHNLALPGEKVGVELWSQARISTPGCDIANFYSCLRDNCSRFAVARHRI